MFFFKEVSHDPSQIILILLFGAQETMFKTGVAQYFCRKKKS